MVVFTNENFIVKIFEFTSITEIMISTEIMTEIKSNEKVKIRTYIWTKSYFHKYVFFNVCKINECLWSFLAEINLQ